MLRDIIIALSLSNLCFVNVWRSLFITASVSYYYFIHKQTTGSAIKAFLSSTAVIIIWTTISFMLIFLYILNGFWGLLH